MAKVEIPYPLRLHTEGKKVVEISGTSIVKVLQQLTLQFPGIAPYLFTNDNQLHKFVLVYLDDEDIRYKGGLEAPVTEGSILKIIPALAGGTHTSGK